MTHGFITMRLKSCTVFCEGEPSYQRASEQHTCPGEPLKETAAHSNPVSTEGAVCQPGEYVSFLSKGHTEHPDRAEVCPGLLYPAVPELREQC